MRTIPRHLKTTPHDRALQVRISRNEIDMAMLDVSQPVGVGKATDLCEFIGTCHYTCFRTDAQNCSTYESLYQQRYQR